jgi:hypothetical protein
MACIVSFDANIGNSNSDTEKYKKKAKIQTSEVPFQEDKKDSV